MPSRSALITRKQLNPYEEARAVKAMLDRGLTEDGAAQALGWPKNRVTARVKILELPERAQQLIGEGVIHLAAVDQLRAIGNVAPGLLDALTAYLDDGNAWAAERLTREPGWVLDAAVTHSGDGKVFAAYLHSARSREIADLRLGKKTEQHYEQTEKLHKQLDRYAHVPPQVRFSDADVDQPRAAGVLIEFDGPGRPIIVDRALYRRARQDRDQAHARRTRGQGRRGRQGEEDHARGEAARGPVTVAKRERDAQLRELTGQAHGANLDLGHALIHNLTSVDPTDINVARFFVLCGRPHRTDYVDFATVPQAVQAVAFIARTQRLDGRQRAADVLGDLARWPTLTGHQHDPGAIDQAPLGRPRARPPLKHRPILSHYLDPLRMRCHRRLHRHRTRTTWQFACTRPYFLQPADNLPERPLARGDAGGDATQFVEVEGARVVVG
jgi:hypothetical protein